MWFSLIALFVDLFSDCSILSCGSGVSWLTVRCKNEEGTNADIQGLSAGVPLEDQQAVSQTSCCMAEVPDEKSANTHVNCHGSQAVHSIL